MNQPLVPQKSLPLPKPIEKPIAQYMMKQIATFTRIFPATAPAFFMRESPISSIANPACMNSTSVAVTTTQMALAAMSVLDDGSPPGGPSAIAAMAGAASTNSTAHTGTSRSDLNRMHTLLSQGDMGAAAAPTDGVDVPAGP